MDPGRLDRRITIETNTPSQDSFGQELPGWHPAAATTPARYMPAAGTEGPQGQIIAANQTAVFRIRYRAGIDPKLSRVRFDGEIWEIKDVAEPKGFRRQYLDLTCVAADVKSGA